MQSRIRTTCDRCGNLAYTFLVGDHENGDEHPYCTFCDQHDDAILAAAERGELADEMDWADA